MATELSAWQSEPSPLVIKNSEVHLWRFSLKPEVVSLATLKKLLSRNELDRAARLLDANKSHDFILARSYLRSILGKYLQLPPEEIRFRYNQHRKPFIAAVHKSDIQFNLSHSHSQAVLAVASANEIGIDIEWIDPALNYQSLAEHFFLPEEQSLLNGYPVDEKNHAFYRLWTRKEALLKCLGCGFHNLTEPLMQITEPFKTIQTFPLMGNFLCTCVVQNEVKCIIRINTPKLTQMLINLNIF
ncbi:MAG: 4'-phosphopantetheinyl transferase superfamily protein [Deltaproteobacteria bacterium]|nr:4'-phosphopantetheinyl transferase superfamily protein [Deltaproteobacteria bacterium]MCW8891893.1 4'-phosphopantetheinyl transferase superfamily protein [Deltaproteobacteria bacterium]MCW9049790.1 4'-phosphopantetheinyl transferase superfamily protein [Deltaproteobacteria bacterium]